MRINSDRIASLAEFPACPATVAFYDRYHGRIATVKDIEQRNSILADMQQDFETKVRQDPQNRNALSGIYQLLKQKCMEVVL